MADVIDIEEAKAERVARDPWPVVRSKWRLGTWSDGTLKIDLRGNTLTADEADQLADDLKLVARLARDEVRRG